MVVDGAGLALLGHPGLDLFDLVVGRNASVGVRLAATVI